VTAERGVPVEPVRTVFFGSGRFGVESLRRLDVLDEQRVIDLIGVVTAPARAAGRRQKLTTTPVEDAAVELGIPTILTPSRLRSPDGIDAVQTLRPELIVLVDYGQIVPGALLEVPYGALNLHPSLLPRHRGATPIPAAILAGDAKTGVTLMRMDEGLDTGPIVAQVPMDLTGVETSLWLEDILEQLGADLLERSIGPWVRGELTTTPQPEESATVTRPLTREDGRLDPGRTALELERQVRAYLPWPGSFAETPLLGRLIVHEAEVGPGLPGDRPGVIAEDDKGLALATTDGRLRLVRVQLPGGRPMDGAALRRGAPELVGQTVGLR
jgi:methionyl-tRNA formyltransferase